MAKDNIQVPSTENTPTDEGQQVPEQSTTETTTVEGAESSPEPKVDYEGKIRGFEERLNRAEERNRYLEQTSRLLEEDRQNRHNQQQIPPKTQDDLSAELLDLDKTLDPIFSRRLKSVTQPLVDTVSRLYDEQDSSRFEMYLMRNHPDVFEEEGGMDKVFQEVEQVRQQAARNYNQWLSRVDAFLYAQGIRGVQDKYKSRKEKKSAQVHEEAKRLQSVKAAGSGVQNTQPRRSVGADIQSIREKAQRGERLTDAERSKYRDFIADQTF